MAPGRNFVRYIAVAVFILVFEYGNAHHYMLTDSLYGDHVVSGIIHPISGAVPRKISEEMMPQSNANSMMDSIHDSNRDISGASEISSNLQKDSNKNISPYSSNRVISPASNFSSNLQKANGMKLEEMKPQTKEMKPHKKEMKPRAKGKKPRTKGRKPHTKGRKPHTKGRMPHTKGRKPHTKGRMPHTKGRKTHTKGKNPQTNGMMPHTKERKPHREEMKPQSNTHRLSDSLYGDHVVSGIIIPISGAIPKKINGHRQSRDLSEDQAISKDQDLSEGQDLSGMPGV